MAQDSSFALAYAGISMVESVSYFFGYQKDYNRLERAENLARQALSLDGNLPEGHLALGEFFAYSERHEEAITSYRVSLDGKPDNPIVWCHLSYSCRNSDPIDLDGAEYAARMAIKQQPTYIWSYVNLGSTLRLKEQFAEAIETYQYCIELNPNWQYPYLNIGSIHLTQGNYDLAMEIFRRADEISDDPDINVSMSFVYAAQGEKGLALTELEEAFKAGYSYFDLIESSPHYHSLRNDDEFKALVSKFRDQ
jgi:tetratricopeptide (TPR) repeat protein